MLDRLIQQLRANHSERKDASIPFREFRNQNEIAAVAQAFHGNEHVCNCNIDFREVGDGDIPVLNWNPLLDVLANRENLKTVRIWNTLDRRDLTRFRDQFLQALQQNTHLHRLILGPIDFSNNNSEGIVTLLDGAPNLTELSFSLCRASGIGDARNIAAAFSRNSRIRTFGFHRCGANLLCPILQALAFADRQSCITKFVYTAYYSINDEDCNLIAEAMQQYLESSTATTQCLELSEINFSLPSGASKILQGLSRNTTVCELLLDNCTFDDEEHAQMLADLVRRNPNLATLRVLNYAPDRYLNGQVFLSAIVANLAWRESPLRCLEVGPCIRVAEFQTLMRAVKNSTTLEHLVLKNISANQVDLFQVLLGGLPSFKIKEITLELSQEFLNQEDLLLKAIKRNYVIQSVHCTIHFPNEDFFTAANQSRLEFYLDRNRKLAEWTANPKLVPRELWQYAMMLALKAGINPLYESLLALSGQGIGLRRQGRKRKRPQYYKPSSS